MNKVNKFVTIVLALFVSFFTNVKGEIHRPFIDGKWTEPTGGIAEVKIADDGKTLTFALLNGDTPGSWKCKIDLDNHCFVFLEGPFKDQKYNFVVVSAGVAELHEQGGRKTKWAKVKK